MMLIGSVMKSFLLIAIKQVWINGGDIILLGLRDFQDTKADVILKYTADEARNLKAYGELPESSQSLFIKYFVYFVVLTEKISFD